MKFTANTDIEIIAKRVLEEIAKLEAQTAQELHELSENRELRDEVKAEKRAGIIDGYKAIASEISDKYGRKVDAIASEIRKLAAKIEPPAPNPANAAIIQMLSSAPEVTDSMLRSAIESVKDDVLSLEILRQIAQKNGFEEIAMMPAPVKSKLMRSDLESIAADIQSNFRWYFNSHSAYNEYPDNIPQSEYEQREAIVNYADRAKSGKILDAIGSGAAFQFDNVSVSAEFAALAATAEL